MAPGTFWDTNKKKETNGKISSFTNSDSLKCDIDCILQSQLLMLSGVHLA